jgi:hypothetical protein
MSTFPDLERENVTHISGTLHVETGIEVAGAPQSAIASGVTASVAELNLLDGAVEANSVASLAAVLDSSKRLQSDASDGTAGTNVTAVEYGDGFHKIAMLTLSSVALTIGDNVSLGSGALIYTLPAGAVVVNNATMSVGVTLTTGTPTTDQPEIGLGTVIASGVVSVLGGTATFEDIMAGATTPVLADLAGTAEVFTHNPGLVIEAAAAHTVHLNIADAYADVTDTAATATGTIVLDYTLLPLA